MLKLRLMVGIAILIITSTISATNVNGRFVVTSTDSLKLSVLLQINTNTGIDSMGGATIVVGFDTSSIRFNSSPVKDVDYLFHNFCGGNYSVGTVTRPVQARIWVNIDLPYNNSNNGTLVSGSSSGWTDVVTLYFDIIDPEGSASIYWLHSSPFWGIYDDDNLTLWNTGTFESIVNFPVPVELGSFTASLLENSNVLLRWSTVSSINNQGFEIEKSVSSKQSSVGNNSETIWERIGFVESMGNSTTLMEYSFIDMTLHIAPVVQYRLKMIDMNGSYNYSDVIEVYTGPADFELSQNYPNPFNPSTMITYTIPGVISTEGRNPKVSLKVFDILGNEVATLVDEEKSSGRYEVSFNAAGFASGVYIYRLMSDNPSTSSGQGFVETKKMVLLR
jgi:hypothetical protein